MQAIIHAIAGVNNVSVKKAEESYMKGRSISNRYEFGAFKAEIDNSNLLPLSKAKTKMQVSEFLSRNPHLRTMTRQSKTLLYF